MSLLSSSLRGTSYLIGLQAGSRLLTFALNQLILRYTNPSIFGFATIQLELLLSTVLFLCREGCRVAVQRLPASSDAKVSQVVVNLSYLPVLAGLLLSTACTTLFLYTASEESAAIPYFHHSVILYALSTIVELASEPGYNTALHQMDYKTRASCEGVAVLVRCLTAFAVARYGGQSIGALGFACGQFAYSATLLCMYLIKARCHWRPARIDNIWVNTELLMLSFWNTLQSVLKHILTEGDKLMISYFCSNAEQGKYALSANYGGLLARMIFQPVEEATRSYFSNQLPSDLKDRKGRLQQARFMMSLMLRIYLLASMIMVCVLPPVITSLLPSIVGPTWSAIVPVLAWYVYYIPILAVNGILEAFITATASTSLLKQQSILWIICSIAFGIFGFAGRHLGAIGLVLANCGNLSIRIAWAGYHTARILSMNLATFEILPNPGTIAVLIGLGSVIRSLDNADLRQYLISLAASGLVSMSLVVLFENSWAKKKYIAFKSQ